MPQESTGNGSCGGITIFISSRASARLTARPKKLDSIAKDYNKLRIRRTSERAERTAPVKFGEGSRGKRHLVQAVMRAGFSKRTAIKAVDATIDAWKAALSRHERVEMPMGFLKVRKTPDRLRKRRYAATRIGKRHISPLATWTVYNDPYRVVWRAPRHALAELIDLLNPGLPPEPVEAVVPLKKKKGPAHAPVSAEPGFPPRVALLPFPPQVPSRTDRLRRR